MTVADDGLECEHCILAFIFLPWAKLSMHKCLQIRDPGSLFVAWNALLYSFFHALFAFWFIPNKQIIIRQFCPPVCLVRRSIYAKWLLKYYNGL